GRGGPGGGGRGGAGDGGPGGPPPDPQQEETLGAAPLSPLTKGGALLPPPTLPPLHTRPHTVDNEPKIPTQNWHASLRSLDRHAIRLELLDERVEIFDLKSDVIDPTAFRGNRRRRSVCRKKINFIAVEHR